MDAVANPEHHYAEKKMVPDTNFSERKRTPPSIRRRVSGSELVGKLPASRVLSSLVKINTPTNEYDRPLAIAHMRIESDEDFAEKYATLRLLGKGSFGSVHLVQDRSSEGKGLYASKEVHKEQAGSKGILMLELEIAVLKKIEHPHIVALHEVYETAKKTFLVMEVCEGGTLQDIAVTRAGHPALKQPDVATIIRRTARAVAYLHDSGIVHRDLKPENIMLKSKGSFDVKICDFGLCAFLTSDQHQMELVCGTPAFMAPEVLAKKGQYSPLCDVWSIGVILYFLITGGMPYTRTKDDDTVLDAILSTPLHLSALPAFADDSLQAVQTAMMHIDPARRITAKEICDHPWVTGCGEAGTPQHGVLDMMMMFKAAATGDGGNGDDGDAVDGHAPLSGWNDNPVVRQGSLGSNGSGTTADAASPAPDRRGKQRRYTMPNSTSHNSVFVHVPGTTVTATPPVDTPPGKHGARALHPGSAASTTRRPSMPAVRASPRGQPRHRNPGSTMAAPPSPAPARVGSSRRYSAQHGIGSPASTARGLSTSHSTTTMGMSAEGSRQKPPPTGLRRSKGATAAGLLTVRLPPIGATSPTPSSRKKRP